MRAVLPPLWLVPLGLLACSPDAAPAGTDAATDPACHATRQRDDGTCCADGSVFDYATATCAAVGPPACASQLFASPASCRPRWCAAQLDTDGHECAPGATGCLPGPRDCADTELLGGCLAGEAPDAPGSCRPAGRLTGPYAADAAMEVAPLPPLPPLSSPRWCRFKGGTAVCGADGQGCPTGHRMDAKGGCHPTDVPASCPPGFVFAAAAPGAGPPAQRCAPDDKLCPPGPWPANLPGTGVVYVSAAAKAGGDGSAAKPFATLGQALAAAPSGATVALSAGTYKGPFMLTKAVRIVGRCAALTRLSAGSVLGVVRVKTPIPSGAGEPAVDLRGLTISGGGIGLPVTAKVSVRGRGLLFDAPSTAGAAAIGAGARIELQDTVIRDVVHVGKASRGLEACAGGRLVLKRVRVEGSRDIGVLVTGKGSVIDAEGLDVLATRAIASTGLHGRAIEVNGGGGLELRTGLVDAVQDVGLRVSGAGTRAWVQGLAVRCGGLAVRGAGVLVRQGANLDLRGAHVAGCRNFGVGVDGPGTEAILHGLSVHDTVALSGGDGGIGVRVGGGADMTLMGAHIRDNRRIGVMVVGKGTEAVVRDILVAGTRSTAVGDPNGYGLAVGAGGRADIAAARLHDNRSAGLLVQDDGSYAKAADITVDATRPIAVNLGGLGALVRWGGQLEIAASRLSGNHLFGALVHGAGAVMRADQLVVDRTRPSPSTGESGVALAVSDGGRLSLDRSRLSESRAAGLLLAATETFARVSNTLIDRTDVEPHTGYGGHGIEVVRGARCHVRFSRITRCRAAGVLAAHKGTDFTAVGVRIDRTTSDLGPFSSGAGIQVSAGARATLAGCALLHNHTVGAMAGQSGADLRIVGTLLQHTHSEGATGRDAVGMDGIGAAAVLGASLAVHSCVLHDNSVAGLMYTGGATGDVRDTVIRRTREAAFERLSGRVIRFGDGVAISGGGAVKLSHSLITESTRGGLVAVGSARVSAGGLAVFANDIGLARADTALQITAPNAVFANTGADERGDANLPMPAAPGLVQP